MVANHHIDDTHKLIFTTWEGAATDADCTSAMKNYLVKFSGNAYYSHYNEMVDCRNVTHIDVTPAGICKLSKMASEFDKNRSHTKLALLVSSDLAYGMARMYELYRSAIPGTRKDIRVFKKENDALEWINHNE